MTFRLAYQALRKLNSKPSSQVDPPPLNLDAGSAEIPLLDPPISENPPSLTEFRGAISKLKNGKAAGICGIPDKLLKAGGESMAWGLHAVLSAIWQSGTVPPLLLRDVVIPLWKEKGGLMRHQRLEQSGFTPGKSTIDCILERLEPLCELLAAYIDFKKAFRTVHRESLWEILRLRGIPTRIIGLIASLYTGTERAKGTVHRDFAEITPGYATLLIKVPLILCVIRFSVHKPVTVDEFYSKEFSSTSR
ncbi:uncharacterized protein [Penaeus vannamei]|uniref:uncharacterized protein n=1 Tax=Penaeus vannamei TaxID=6689 RepID=UPI00387F3E61